MAVWIPGIEPSDESVPSFVKWLQVKTLKTPSV